MARKEKARGRSERLQALVAAGDHGGARAEAPEADRAAAARVVAALRPDTAAVAVAIASVVVALAIAAWTLARG
jgi:hypothetical protein